MGKSAYEKTRELQDRLVQRGLPFINDRLAVNALRRAERTLHRWSELECGDGDNYKSWCISRNEETGIPYMEIHPNNGKMTCYRVPDREKGALKRIASLCKYRSIFFYHQTDPRGCQLYISNEPLNDSNYTSGVAIY